MFEKLAKMAVEKAATSAAGEDVARGVTAATDYGSNAVKGTVGAYQKAVTFAVIIAIAGAVLAILSLIFVGWKTALLVVVAATAMVVILVVRTIRKIKTNARAVYDDAKKLIK